LKKLQFSIVHFSINFAELRLVQLNNIKQLHVYLSLFTFFLIKVIFSSYIVIYPCMEFSNSFINKAAHFRSEGGRRELVCMQYF